MTLFFSHGLVYGSLGISRSPLTCDFFCSGLLLNMPEFRVGKSMKSILEMISDSCPLFFFLQMTGHAYIFFSDSKWKKGQEAVEETVKTNDDIQNLKFSVLLKLI